LHGIIMTEDAGTCLGSWPVEARAAASKNDSGILILRQKTAQGFKKKFSGSGCFKKRFRDSRFSVRKRSDDSGKGSRLQALQKAVPQIISRPPYEDREGSGSTGHSD
jgi:hypothetical protein